MRSISKVAVITGALTVFIGAGAAQADRLSASGQLNGVTYEAKYLCSADHTEIYWHATATNTDSVAHDVDLLIDMDTGPDGAAAATLQPGQSLSTSVTFTVPNPLYFQITVDGDNHNTGEGWSQGFADTVCAFPESTTPDEQLTTSGSSARLLTGIAAAFVAAGSLLLFARRRLA